MEKLKVERLKAMYLIQMFNKPNVSERNNA